MSLITVANRVYPDRRDRYGYTFLSRLRAVRAIKRCDDEAVRRLIDTDVLDTLVRSEVILPLRFVCGDQDEYVFLVQKRICPAIVPSEWSPMMFADAAILILRAEKALQSHGMTVDDPHPWNILFDEGKPYIIDMGAFNVLGTGVHWSADVDTDIWPAGNVFNGFFLNAVTLIAAGRAHYVRRTLTDWNPISGSDAALLLIKKPIMLFQFLSIRLHVAMFRWVWQYFSPIIAARWKRKLKSAYLAALSGYAARIRSRIIQCQAPVDVDRNISAAVTDAIPIVIDRNKSQRVLVYGAQRNAVDWIMAAGALKLLVVSPDDTLIDSLYKSGFGGAGAVMDLRSPTPGAGPGNRWITPAIERFKSEVGVFFFDLEEMVIEKCLTVSELIQAAHNMSSKAAIIIFGKLQRNRDISGRDYGQTTDSVLLTCLKESLGSFKIIHNDCHEMVVTFNSNNPTFSSNES